MREIKFRAWNSETRTMVDLYKITPLAVTVPQDGLFLPFKEGWPLMQYTGLKDKNGKEIYEGDIVGYWAYAHRPSPSRKVTVGWHNTTRTTGFNISIGHSGNQLERYVVLGNIHETPELLTKEES